MRAARGFSLVELMIAIVLGLLITDAMVAMFVGVRSASRTTVGVAALSDSGRFALDSMEQVVRGAGNMACNSTAPVTPAGVTLTRVVSALNAGATPLVSDYDQALAGYEAVGSAPGDTLSISSTPAADTSANDWVTTPALGSALDGAVIAAPTPMDETAPTGAPIAGSDVLVVHETLPGAKPAYTLAAVPAGPGSFPISSSTTFAGGGQIGMISNCVQTEVFQVASFTPASATVSLTGAVSPGNDAGDLTINFDVGAQVDPADVIVFYVGVGADGDGALFKYESNGGVLGDTTYSVNQELVPDVENMQILYGVETASSQSTQTAAQYVTADQVAATSITGDFNGVISVKIALLVASPPGSVPQGAAAAASPPTLLGTNWAMAAPDNRMRKVYDQTMFLRNMSP